MKVKLGTGSAGDFVLDIAKLIATRLLIQANSGGGKSYIVRKLLEVTFGKIQHIVLDMEGDFATLREKYDYILAGQDGDIPAHPESAGVLARKILELKSSVIIDLYELEHWQRIRFVKLFLEAMINARKSLWHPVLVILDEAHVFAPEKSKAESVGAVIEMASRGRKRGFCLVPATQRLAKLNKDVAAECNNKMIGRTGLDLDMKRASDELGFTSKQQLLSIRDLNPGEFFVFGPALTRSVERVKVGKVLTTHPDTSKGIKSYTPAATSKVKSVLTKLKDLPQKAQDEIRTLEEAKAEVRKLKRELRTVPVKVDEKAIDRAYQKGLAQGQTGIEKYKQMISKALGLGGAASKALNELQKLLGKKSVDKPPIHVETVRPPLRSKPAIQTEPIETGAKLGKCERGILEFLISYPGKEFSKAQVGVMSGYSYTSGPFGSAVARLNVRGLVKREGRNLIATEEGNRFPGIEPNAGSLEAWMSRLSKCERSIFKVLADSGQEMSRDDVGQATNYVASSGPFGSAVARLNVLGLIKRNGNGTIMINPEISEL